MWLINQGYVQAVKTSPRRWWVEEASARARAEEQLREGEQWVSHVEAARIVGCSPRTILRAANDGDIQSRRGAAVAAVAPSLIRRDFRVRVAKGWPGHSAVRLDVLRLGWAWRSLLFQTGIRALPRRPEEARVSGVQPSRVSRCSRMTPMCSGVSPIRPVAFATSSRA